MQRIKSGLKLTLARDPDVLPLEPGFINRTLRLRFGTVILSRVDMVDTSFERYSSQVDGFPAGLLDTASPISALVSTSPWAVCGC